MVRDRNDLSQKEKLMDWVSDRQTSVWAGNDEELHIKVTSDYSNFIEDKDDVLAKLGSCVSWHES